MSDDDFLTPHEVSDILKMSIETLKRWRAENYGPAHVTFRRRVRYRRSVVEEWIKTETAAQATSRRAAGY